MSAVIIACGNYSLLFPLVTDNNILVILGLKIATGAVSYLLFLWFFDRSLFENIKKLRRY